MIQIIPRYTRPTPLQSKIIWLDWLNVVKAYTHQHTEVTNADGVKAASEQSPFSNRNPTCSCIDHKSKASSLCCASHSWCFSCNNILSPKRKTWKQWWQFWNYQALVDLSCVSVWLVHCLWPCSHSVRAQAAARLPPGVVRRLPKPVCDLLSQPTSMHCHITQLWPSQGELLSVSHAKQCSQVLSAVKFALRARTVLLQQNSTAIEEMSRMDQRWITLIIQYRHYISCIWQLSPTLCYLFLMYLDFILHQHQYFLRWKQSVTKIWELFTKSRYDPALSVYKWLDTHHDISAL